MSRMETMKHLGMPVVAGYFQMKENVFLNMAHGDARGLEKAGNLFLSPYQYLCGGKRYSPITTDPKSSPTLQCDSVFPVPDPVAIEMLKIVASILLLPLSLLMGATCKGLSLLGEGAKQHHRAITVYAKSHIVNPRLPPSSIAEKIETVTRFIRPKQALPDKQRTELAPLLGNGITIEQQEEIAALPPVMQKNLLALKDLVALLDKHNIPYWLDAGSLLGSHRHEGVIPWDEDVDIAICQEDHEDVMRAGRDPDFSQRYQIMDWSTADKPRTFIKMYIKESKSLIDIYHYRREKDQFHYLSPHYNKWYMPHALNIREVAQLNTPIPAAVLFPLKRAQFDGIEVSIPQNRERYLKNIYDEDLGPTKIWDPQKGKYCKVENHPYWTNY